jgi:hypothetical protein
MALPGDGKEAAADGRWRGREGWRFLAMVRRRLPMEGGAVARDGASWRWQIARLAERDAGPDTYSILVEGGATPYGLYKSAGLPAEYCVLVMLNPDDGPAYGIQSNVFGVESVQIRSGGCYGSAPWVDASCGNGTLYFGGGDSCIFGLDATFEFPPMKGIPETVSFQMPVTNGGCSN